MRCLQRLFTTFPGGLPGTGLLLLRTTLGVSSIIHGAGYLSESTYSASWSLFAGTIIIACGAVMVIGFLTPVVGALLFIGGLISVVLSYTSSAASFSSSFIYEVVLSAAFIVLGPGAYSVDAWAFGRREIVIPKN